MKYLTKWPVEAIHRFFCWLWNHPYQPDVYDYSLPGLVGEIISRTEEDINEFGNDEWGV